MIIVPYQCITFKPFRLSFHKRNKKGDTQVHHFTLDDQTESDYYLHILIFNLFDCIKAPFYIVNPHTVNTYTIQYVKSYLVMKCKYNSYLLIQYNSYLNSSNMWGAKTSE